MPHHGMIADRALLQMLTARVIEYKFWLQDERKARDTRMAIEIKGLKAKALKAASNLERLNLAYDKFNEAAPAHAADVEGLAPQLEALVEDLTFAAQTLGNSVNGSQGSEKPKEQPGEKQFITADDIGKIDQAIISGSPAVEQTEQHFPHDPL